MIPDSKYLKIYEETKDEIVRGIYKYGEKLPSKRVYADMKGVSIITVMHAYELLADEGYISPKEKSGYFVSFDEADTYSEIGSKEQLRIEPVKTDLRDKEGFSFSVYSKTVRRVLAEYEGKLFERSEDFGLKELREAIASYLARSRNIYASPECIIIGYGAEYLYSLILEAFGREITYGIEKPSYHKIEKVYTAGGAITEGLALGNDGIESEALRTSTAKILHVSPYRSFPSSVMASAGKKREYLRWALERDAVIVEDDFESEFSPLRKPEETLFFLGKGDRVIYLNTFSQTIGPFIKIAYMVVPERFIETFKNRTGFHSCPVPTLEQFVLTELLNSGAFERHINKVRRALRKKN